VEEEDVAALPIQDTGAGNPSEESLEKCKGQFCWMFRGQMKWRSKRPVGSGPEECSPAARVFPLPDILRGLVNE